MMRQRSVAKLSKKELKMSTLTEDEIALQNPDLYNSLHSLLRANPSKLQTYLEKVACMVSIKSSTMPPTGRGIIIGSNLCF